MFKRNRTVTFLWEGKVYTLKIGDTFDMNFSLDVLPGAHSNAKINMSGTLRSPLKVVSIK